MHWLPTFIQRCSCFWTNVYRQLYHTRNIAVRNSTFKQISKSCLSNKNKILAFLSSQPPCKYLHFWSIRLWKPWDFFNPHWGIKRVYFSSGCSWWIFVGLLRFTPGLCQYLDNKNNLTLKHSLFMGFIVFTDTFTREKTIHLSTNTTHISSVWGIYVGCQTSPISHWNPGRFQQATMCSN